LISRIAVSIAGLVRAITLVAGLLPFSQSHAVTLLFGVEFLDHDYTEFAESGAALVSESGQMFAPAVGIEHAFESGLIIGLEHWSTDGALDYRGATQSGQPLFTSAEQEFDRTSGLLAYRFTRDNWFLRFQAMYSDWRWERRIEETTISLPLAIDYDWEQWSVGLSVGQVLPWGLISVGIEHLENVGARARLDLEDYGGGQVVLQPEDDQGIRLTLTHEYRWSPRWSVTQYLYVEEQGFAASDTVGVAGSNSISLFHEPASETRRVGLGLAFSYSFE
jgi:hypothetical protein